MKRILPLAAAFLLLVASGVGQGLWTGRWGVSADVKAAAARCDRIAMNLGEWEGQPVEMSPEQLAMAEIDGHCSRRYVNRRTGQEVRVLLVCGRPGPISVHPPDVCYTGAGYAVVAPPQRHHVEADPAADFMTTRFAKPGVEPDPLRIFWGWTDGGPLTAPDNPRLTFARAGALYKLYVIRRMGSTDEPLDHDACLDFINVLLPELQKCLSPNP